MKQLLILSGKGGTGKTTLAASFIALSQAEAYADCDVDAPNLHLVQKQTQNPVLTDFYGMGKAWIQTDLCIHCDQCRTACRFGAIAVNEQYVVDPLSCEGCGICVHVCPQQAIQMVPHKAGVLSLFMGDAVFSTAQLKMGSGTSGKLVTDVKKNLLSHAKDKKIAIIDGSPGIGCPVIASMSGVDLILLVTEPTISGMSDLKRIVETAIKFQVPVVVCVNKYTIHLPTAESIETYCNDNGIPFVGKIPFDNKTIQAIQSGQRFLDMIGPTYSAIEAVYKHTMEILETQKNTKGVQIL